MVDKRSLVDFLGCRRSDKKFKVIHCENESETLQAGPLLESILGEEQSDWYRHDGHFWEFIFLNEYGKRVNAYAEEALLNNEPYEIICFEEFMQFVTFGSTTLIDVEDLL